jgi:3-phenylpropionate/cinnamic acid dioxygenase small subunit
VTQHDDRAAEHDIAKVLVRYAAGIDRRDWDLFRSCFTSDCRADYEGIAVWEGADAITEFMTGSHAGLGYTLHRLSNLAITVNGGTAMARSYVDAVLMSGDGQSGLNAIGFYDDELVRTSDVWRIANRRYTPVRLGTI